MGLRLVRGDYVMLLDVDTEVRESTVDLLLGFMERHPDVSLAAPRIYTPEGRIEQSARNLPSLMNGLFGRQSTLTRLFPGNPFSRRYLAPENLEKREPFQVEQVSAACMFIRRSVVAEAGRGRGYRCYWVDSDWCAVEATGQEVYCVPDAGIVHYENNRAGKEEPWRIWHFHIGALVVSQALHRGCWIRGRCSPLRPCRQGGRSVLLNSLRRDANQENNRAPCSLSQPVAGFVAVTRGGRAMRTDAIGRSDAVGGPRFCNDARGAGLTEEGADGSREAPTTPAVESSARQRRILALKKLRQPRKPIAIPDPPTFSLGSLVLDGLYRFSELLFALAVLLVSAPLLLGICVLIRWDTRGPVFFIQRRTGRSRRVRGRSLADNGEIVAPERGFDPEKYYWMPTSIAFVKFRTMYHDAAERFPEYYWWLYDLAPDEVHGMYYKLEDDPRVTPVGKWLRTTSLDELPNFWNVLTGDLHLVGPRPEAVEIQGSTMRSRCSSSRQAGLTCTSKIYGRRQPSRRRQIAGTCSTCVIEPCGST
jgi:lipopolysaccharide/colanic/teichoic acid biosynthesis glycosyltransferase